MKINIAPTSLLMSKSDMDDKKISWAIMASFVVLTIQYFVLIYFELLNSSGESIIQMLSKAIVGLAFLFASYPVLKRSLKKILVVYCIAAIVFLVQFLLFPENKAYLIKLIFPVFFMSLPSFLFTLSIENYQIFRNTVKQVSLIIFVVGNAISILVFLGIKSIGAYSMSLSYYMLLPAIMFLDEFLDDFKFLPLVCSSLTIVSILALGSRGAVLCVLVFIILKIIRPSKNNSIKSKVWKVLIILFGIIGYIYFDDALQAIDSYLRSYNIESRTLRLFLQTEIHLSGRDSIYELVIKSITDNPLLGIGLGGDTRVIGGGYSHNFFLEILSGFGVVVGIILIFIQFILLLKSLVTTDESKYNLTIIWLAFGFIHLMVSSSYLIDIKFWVYLGILIGYKKPRGDKVV